jgi:hypothetical protein
LTRYFFGAAHEQFSPDDLLLKEVEQLGATVVALMNVSGADPHGAIATYREHVLPRLR